MKFKMTTEEKNWVLYDVGNSAFVLLASTIIPIYFNYLAEKAGLSSQGYAWGYIGSCVPFVICLGLVLGASKIGLSMEMSMIISFAIIALWWFGLPLPLLKIYKQKYYVEKQPKAISNSFKRLGTTLKNIRKEKKIFLFLLAFFFYIDGVYTIIDMATAYGTALEFESTGLLLALLLTQVVAFPFAILFGRLATKSLVNIQNKKVYHDYQEKLQLKKHGAAFRITSWLSVECTLQNGTQQMIMTLMKHVNVFFSLTNQKSVNCLRKNSRTASHWFQLRSHIITAKSKSSLVSVKVKTIMTNVIP